MTSTASPTDPDGRLGGCSKDGDESAFRPLTREFTLLHRNQPGTESKVWVDNYLAAADMASERSRAAFPMSVTGSSA